MTKIFLLLPAERCESADDFAEVGPDQSHCVGSTIAFLPELRRLEVVLTCAVEQLEAFGLFVLREQTIQCLLLFFGCQYGRIHDLNWRR